jgi:hypothetical protein
MLPMPTARDTLAEVWALSSQGQDQLSRRSNEERVVELSVRAGDPARARTFAESIADRETRVAVLGRYGVALARSGDLPGARAALDLVHRASTAAEGSEQDERAPETGRSRLHFPHDFAIEQIGAALADGHDARGALHAATLLPHGLFRAELLADIAAKQCTAGDKEGRDTLRLAVAAAYAVGQHGRLQSAAEIAYALATCNDVAAAVAAARGVAPDYSVSALERVAHDLTEHGDYTHARQIDEANADALVGIGDRIALAERQIARGEVELAKPNLAKASAMTIELIRTKRAASRPLYEIVDAQRPIGSIIAGQTAVRAYAEAIHTSEGEDEPDNRAQFLVPIVWEEASRHDEFALRETLPGILEVIQKASRGIAAYNLARVAKALASAGYIDDARKALALAQGLASRENAEIARAQAAMGDMDGARATLDALDARGGARGRNLISVALEQDDFATALAAAADLQGATRDGGLAAISREQTKSGDITGAMATTWQIQNLISRADTLLAVLKALRRA